MGNIVLVKKMHELEQMKSHYQDYLVDRTPEGSVFSARTPQCTITAYKSGKVLFQGKDCEQEAEKWGGHALDIKSNRSPVASHLPANIGSMSIIGSDEVGTGDYFGPITVVAAYVKSEEIPKLQQLGVRDSKHLTDEKITAIARRLVEIVPHSLLTLHNVKYNELQKSGMTQGKMKAMLHNQAIGHVLNKIAPAQPEAILIDQFAKEKIYFNHLKGQPNIQRNQVYFSTKAEGIHLAVAAASIIARYAFIQHFENLGEKAGFVLPKGAGPAVDKAAAKLIHEKGADALPYFVKLHFANTEKAFKIYKNM